MPRTIATDNVGLAQLDRGSTREVGRLMMASTRTRYAASAVASVALLSLAACSSSSSTTPHSARTTQTITFALSGLGSEGQYTEAQVSEFEQQNPNIHVTIDVLSSDSTAFLSQVNYAFAADSPTPDLVESDITYTAKWAAAGYLQPVSCSPGQFNQA